MPQDFCYQMLRLFRTSHGYLCQTPKIQSKFSNFLIPICHLHSSSETLVPDSSEFNQSGSMKTCMVQISHPWPEWVELMEKLDKNGYFEGFFNPFRKRELDAKDANRIRTACLNFARDRDDLIRYFSSQDIEVIAGYGCPSIDRKVVNSGKRLRAQVGIDEENVCNSCSLRGNCQRAYVKAREGEGRRTVDVMRLLLAYGLDLVSSMVGNKSCLSIVVEESVRRLLKEMAKHGMKELKSYPPTTKWDLPVPKSSTHQGQDQISISTNQGYWICFKCRFKNFARNTKCLQCDGLFQERHRNLREDQDRPGLKKGDWICDKCNFFNFAKNTRCLKCNESPPKRQLKDGEWQCDSCNYINFRRNMVCIKCDHRRQRVSYSGLWRH